MIAASLMVSSGIGASILFGWGLDSNPVRMFRLWLGVANIAFALFWRTLYGTGFETWSLFTIMFMWISYVAIYTLTLAYFSHHHEGSEIATVSAWMTIWFLGTLFTTVCMKLVRNKMVMLAYLALMMGTAGVRAVQHQWRTDTMKNVPASPTYGDKAI